MLETGWDGTRKKKTETEQEKENIKTRE